MRRTLFALAAVGVIVTLMAFFLGPRLVARFWPPIASVEWVSFEPRFESTIRAAGFFPIEKRLCGSEDVPVPLLVDLRLPSPTPTHGRLHFATGFPNAGLQLVVTRDGISRIQCCARYQEGRAVYIEIRSPRQQESVASALRDALRKEFPGLPIGLQFQELAAGGYRVLRPSPVLISIRRHPGVGARVAEVKSPFVPFVPFCGQSLWLRLCGAGSLCLHPRSRWDLKPRLIGALLAFA